MLIAAPDAFYEALIVSLRARLCAHGWSVTDFVGVAVRVIETVTGPKEAQAYLLKVAPQGPFVLSGTYYNEGRNVLARVMIPIRRLAAQNEIDAAAQSFARQCDAIIGNSSDVQILRRLR
ncbi:hypothetical protein [Simplicispira suum]|uniref:Uncharacterized protein n=1 Tax=Simplicispira suum TaxID=2109915 RepID=A0A2S0N5Z2_9BURK|nr:hypothetical protein [Simplicispira suum]AVO43564.1 hypothetical protein C6571_19265 [Simplicispira suum]